MIKEIEILRPNDMHVHFRDGDQLSFTVNESSKNFNYVIGSPVGQMDINIEFLERLPEQINLLSQKGVAITTMDEDKNVHTEIGDHSISLRIQNPVSETRYIVEWV